MKKYFYIGCFTLLGILIAQLIHAGAEFPILAWMTQELEVGRNHWLIENWTVVHRVGAVTLWLLGAVSGFLWGCIFWRILYVEERYGKPRW